MKHQNTNQQIEITETLASDSARKPNSKKKK